MSFFRREPDVEILIEAGKSDTAAEALSKMRVFTTLAMRYNVEVVPDATLHGQIRIKGRPKKVERFKRDHVLLQAGGLV